MKFRLILKEQAKLNIEDVALYYNQQRDNLGFEFLGAVNLALLEVKSNPFGYQIKYDTFRAKLVKPFPYLLIYEIIGNDVIVYQCFGGKENPKKRHKK